MSRFVVTMVATVAVSATVAHAQRDERPDFVVLGKIPMPAPEPGVDQAKPMAPTWCATFKDPDGYTVNGLRRTIENAPERNITGLVEAAYIACKWPKEPAVQHGVAVIAQHWMNNTGLSQKDALDAIVLRFDEARFAADREKLCKALAVSDEEEGEEKVFMIARRQLFGCDGRRMPMWLTNERLTFHGGGMELTPFLDSGTQEPDEVVRIAHVLSRTFYVLESKNDYFAKYLANYAVDQVDLAGLSEPAARALLSQNPYKDNIYARAVLVESAGLARLAAARVKAEVDAKAKDADWKEILITAPQRGLEEWNKATGPWKEQLARSVAFEKKFWGPSKKALQGCWPQLRKDFIEVMKSMPKRSTEPEFFESMNEPVPALLFGRLAACAAIDEEKPYALQLLTLSRDVRYSRGPRAAAYFAAIAALTQIKADRTKFPLERNDINFYSRNWVYERAMSYPSEKTIKEIGWHGDAGEATVASVKKEKDGVLVTFVKTKTQVMSTNCTTTNRIVTFEHDGDPIYARNCKNTGMVTVNTTPMPIKVPEAWAEGIKAGAIVKFEATPDYHTGKRWGMPVTVYADKTKKKLVNYYGLGPF